MLHETAARSPARSSSAGRLEPGCAEDEAVGRRRRWRPRRRDASSQLAAIREYFPKHGIIWPVAVADNLPPVMENGRMVRKLNVNDANYKVAGIPQIHIIDRKGTIRLIMIGFDEANEPRLSAMIKRLLEE